MSLSQRRIRARERLREVKEWTRPTVIKKPIYDEHRVEQLITDRRFADELPVEPPYYAIPTETVVKRVFAYHMEHSGFRWMVWPRIPTAREDIIAQNVSVPAGGKVLLGRIDGRGLTRFLGISVDDPNLIVKVWYDGRLDFGMPLKVLWDHFEEVELETMGKIVKWDTVNNIYSYVNDYQEEFDRCLRIEVENPLTAAKTVRLLVTHVHLHEVLPA